MPVKEIEEDLDNTIEIEANLEGDLFISDEGEEFRIAKNPFYKINSANNKDIVYGQFQINLKAPLPQLSSGMGAAYAVTDKKTGDAESFYAILLDKKYPIRLAEINKLLGKRHDNFTNIIGAQLIPTSISAGKTFVVVVEKPKGVTLSEYLGKSGAVSEDAINLKLVPPIHEVIKFLSKKKIVHGRISLDKIYIDAEGGITVGECISEINGYSQNILYENLNRAICLPFAKGNGYIEKVDYFALGVLVSMMLRGRNPVANLNNDEIVDKKFTEKCYKFMSDGLTLSPHMTDLLRGTMNDSPLAVWTSSHVEEWIGGRRYNLLPPTDNFEAGRPIVFNNVKFWNRTHLAHAMHENWSEAKEFIKDDVLIRWIDRSVQDSDLSERMEVLFNRTGVTNESDQKFDRQDELLAQYLMLLDPGAPLRLKGFSAGIDGVASALAYAYGHKDENCIDEIRAMITYDLESYWEHEIEDDVQMESAQNAIFAIQKCDEYLKKKGIGFGMDRCLYELNSTLSCQSDVIAEDSVFNLKGVLVAMNSASKNLANDVVDSHTAAILATRLEIPVAIRIKSLASFTAYANQAQIQVLALLALAQEMSEVYNLDALTEKVSGGLKGIIYGFHSVNIRKEIENGLFEASKNGSLVDLLEVISDNKFLVKDKVGFNRSVKKYRSNNLQLKQFANRKAINNVGYRYGLQMSVISSFFFMTVVIFVLIMKYI